MSDHHNPIMCEDGQFRDLEELLLLQEKEVPAPEPTQPTTWETEHSFVPCEHKYAAFWKKYRA